MPREIVFWRIISASSRGDQDGRPVLMGKAWFAGWDEDGMAKWKNRSWEAVGFFDEASVLTEIAGIREKATNFGPILRVVRVTRRLKSR